MGEEIFVDVSYRGIELGRRLRLEEFSASSAYLHCPAPMPVGSSLLIQTDEGHELSVDVASVIEQVAGADKPPGMNVTASSLEGESESWWQARVNASGTESAAPAESTDEEPAAPDAGSTLIGVEPPIDASDTLVTAAVTADEVAEAAEEMAAAPEEAPPAPEEAPPAAEETKSKPKKKRRSRKKKKKS